MGDVVPLRPNMPAIVCTDKKPRERAVLHAAGTIVAREMAAQILAGSMPKDEAVIALAIMDRMLKRAKGERT